jgi:hypothetical protein
MRFAVCFCLGLLGLSLHAAQSEVLTLSRYFTVKTCYKDASCIGPVAKNIERANIQLELKPGKQGSAVASQAWDRAQVTDDGLQFKSEIHILKHKKPGPFKYTVLMKLRSGNRESKVQKLQLKSLKELDQTVISDEPIAFEGGTLQAQLVIGPKLPLDRD